VPRAKETTEVDEFVVVVTLPGTAEHFTKTCSGLVIIGRSDECDIQLSHPLVSRLHTQISREPDGRFVIRDLGSRNGTTVNGQVLRDDHSVVEGEVTVQVGPYVLLLAPPATADSTTMLVDTEQFKSRVALDRGLRALLVDGETVIERLSVREYSLLDALASAAPSLVESRELGDAVWGDGQWDIYMLHNLIRRIRRKLEEAGAPADELIATVPGVGYRLA
jgi:pSer/pThr/pTyr-binding forkhead associated (FHA) protein